MLSLSGVSVEVKGFSLREISFEVGKGEVMAILGPSGSGKTVLLNTIAGVYRVKRGIIKVDDHDVTEAPPEERKIGYIPQNLALFPHMSVLDNILFGVRSRRLPESIVEDKLRKLVDLLRIQHLLKRSSPVGLSGGEKQRVALARMLLVEPSVILLDEPLSAVDGFMKRQLVLYLKEVFEKLKVAVLYVTHDLEEAFLLADQIGVLLHGRMVQVGRPRDVYYRPASYEVAQLFGSRNVFVGEVEEINKESSIIARTKSGLRCELPWRDDVGIGDSVTFGISPKEISIIRSDRPLRPQVQTNLFSARVNAVLPACGGCLILATLKGFGEHLEIEVPNHVREDLAIEEGSVIEVSLKKSCIWLLPECYTAAQASA